MHDISPIMPVQYQLTLPGLQRNVTTAGGITRYSPQADSPLPRTAYPYTCHFDLVASPSDLKRGISGPPIVISSAQGQATATTYALQATAVSSSILHDSPTATPSVPQDEVPVCALASCALPDEESGLAVGAKVGIVLGSAGAVAVLAVLAWVLYRGRRKAQVAAAKQGASVEAVEKSAQGVAAGKQRERSVTPSRLGKAAVHELPAERRGSTS
jgi:hypothetical protein